jgi:hypothetical protein
MDINDQAGRPAQAEGELPGLQLIREAIARLRFGAIQLTIHDGKLVQLDVTEKTRLNA